LPIAFRPGGVVGVVVVDVVVVGDVNGDEISVSSACIDEEKRLVPSPRALTFYPS
jgi:hypothetical protein